MRPFEAYPEELRETAKGRVEVEIVRPTHWQVVMGAGGKIEDDVHQEALVETGVPLYKRKGGGGTVLLGPNTLVVTVHAGVARTFGNLAYFRAINDALMQVFRCWKNLPFRQKGISDIALEDRKLVGSSIFRRRHYLLYQASVLVELNLDLMARLLKNPPRQPDYRRKREHGDFLTCLRDLGVEQSYEEMAGDLGTRLPGLLRETLRAADLEQTGADAI